MRMAKILLVLSIGIASFAAPCQTPLIDSLRRSLVESHDKLPVLFALCAEGESMPTDSFMAYAQAARRIGMENRDEMSRLRAEFFISRCYSLRGRSDSASAVALRGMRAIGGRARMADLYDHFLWQQIVALTKERRIKESQDSAFRLLRLGETTNDTWAQVTALNNIGVNYNTLRNRPEAKKWMIKAWRAIGESTGESTGERFPQVFTNLAVMYLLEGKFDSTQFCIDHALHIAKQTQSLRTEADCLSIEAQVYAHRNKMDSAERMLKQAAAIQQRTGNGQFILSGLESLASFTATRGQYAKAISYLYECEELSKRYHEPVTLSLYGDMAECYRLLGNYKAYGEALDTLMQLKDSIYQKSKAEDLAKMEVQYEVSKEEAQIARQKLELLHKNLWIGAAALAAALILGAAILLFRRWRRRQSMALEKAEERERKRIAADLHDNLGAYASAISAGLDELDQRPVMDGMERRPVILHLKTLAGEITSSLRDTIWVLNKESITLTGISDRIKIYAQKMQGTYAAVTISVEEAITHDMKLTPMHALHIFRIIQEAIHNALEHSQGNHVTVLFDSQAGPASVTVSDNGNGFDPAARRASGNGLANMRSRAQEAGFGLAFEPAVPKGTRVMLNGLGAAQNTQI